jgi:hypothetical protein
LLIDSSERSLSLLQAIEWEGDSVHHVCPVCRAFKMKGRHESSCRLDAEIRRLTTITQERTHGD